MDTLARNLTGIQERIAAAADRADRDPSAIQLLAVTKTVDPATVDALATLGVKHVGENRVQGLREKHQQVSSALTWHFIGKLQRNKVRKALEVCEWVHSVDSLALAEAINRIAGETGRKIKAFVEVKLTEDAEKHGLSPEEALPVLLEIKKLACLEGVGLMTMASLDEDPQAARPVFRRLRELRDRAREEDLFTGPGLLSMGMTQDFEIAVEEGADWLRIGSALYASPNHA